MFLILLLLYIENRNGAIKCFSFLSVIQKYKNYIRRIDNLQMKIYLHQVQSVFS